MASYDAELLEAARRLLAREGGAKGRLPRARVRRSISTAYYALFHFILEETGDRIVGTSYDLSKRRRILARLISHRGAKAALDKVRGAKADASVEEFLRPRGGPGGPLPTPIYMRNLARPFADAQAKRHEADYDMNKPLSERDAQLLADRVHRVINDWRQAGTKADKDMKHALCLLILLKGQLRADP